VAGWAEAEAAWEEVDWEGVLAREVVGRDWEAGVAGVAERVEEEATEGIAVEPGEEEIRLRCRKGQEQMQAERPVHLDPTEEDFLAQ
jgi:hypothetical protein